MSDVSTFRLYLLRALYLFIALGLVFTIWPDILAPRPNLSHMDTVVRSFLGALSLLAILGVRYPLAMMPVLLFELLWKVIWLVFYGYDLYTARKLTAGSGQTFSTGIMALVLIPLVIPWGYVWRQYVRAAGDRWWGRSAAPR
jgi:hypothetical protein